MRASASFPDGARALTPPLHDEPLDRSSVRRIQKKGKEKKSERRDMPIGFWQKKRRARAEGKVGECGARSCDKVSARDEMRMRRRTHRICSFGDDA